MHPATALAVRCYQRGMSLEAIDGGGDGLARCASCAALAAGPCARCGRPMCGDCVVLTEHGASVWAVCHSCDKRGGRSLRSGWRAALFWLILPIAGLWAVVTILERVAGR